MPLKIAVIFNNTLVDRLLDEMTPSGGNEDLLERVQCFYPFGKPASEILTDLVTTLGPRKIIEAVVDIERKKQNP